MDGMLVVRERERGATMATGYVTLAGGVEASGEFVDRRSRFIAQLRHVESEAEANAFIDEVRARHHDARHNVPAWILADGRERCSDDGEPQRTAGMPTLEVLRGTGLANVCCVVTRYFGGTLLGPGGLVRAYEAATREAVTAAEAAGQFVTMTLVTRVTCVIPYSAYGRVERLIASVENERDCAIESMLLRLPKEDGWLQTDQGRFFASTLFPNLSLCRRLAIRQHQWEEYNALRSRLIKIENTLAETYFSQEQMAVFRDKSIHLLTDCHPQMLHVIRALQSCELMLVTDMEVHCQSFYDLVNIIRQHPETFPEWHNSPTAELYIPKSSKTKNLWWILVMRRSLTYK